MLNTLSTLCQELTQWQKILVLGKTEGKRRGVRQRMRWSVIHSIADAMDVNLSRVWGTVEDRGAWCAAVRGLAESRARSSN